MASGHHWVVPTPGQVQPQHSYTIPAPPVQHPVRYMDLLRRHRLAVGITLAGFTLAGAGLTWLQSPVYRAETTVEIEGSNGNPVFGKDPDSSASAGISQESYMDTRTRLFKSVTLAEHVAEKLHLQERAEIARPGRIVSMLRRSRVASALRLDGRNPVLTRQEAGRLLAASVTAGPEGQSRLVKISVDWPDAQMAATIANALVAEYARDALEGRWNTAKQTTDWLTRQLEEFRRALQQSEEQLQQYAQANGLMFTGENSSVAEDKLRQVQQALSAAQADRIEKQSHMQIASANDPDALPRILEDRPLQELQAKLGDLKRQLADISAIYAPGNSQIRRLKPQIAETEAAVERQRAALLRRVRNEYQAAMEREQLLGNQYSQQTRLVADQSAKTVRYNVLRRDVETNRRLYDSMLQQVRESSVASALRATSVRIVDAAQVPGSPRRPSLPLNTALGFLVGLACSVLIVLIRERTDLRLRMPGQTSLHAGVPELGVIPSIVLRRPLWPWSGSETGDEAWRNPNPLASESFRSALTSLLFSHGPEGRPRLVVITSAGPGEGKSTTAANLAVWLARGSRRVLLVDGDLRKPRLHASFRMTNDAGLSNLLMSGTQESLVRETEVEGLSLLAAGPVTPAAPDLLHSGRLTALLDRWRREFDTVVIDTAPATMFLDARVFARLSDGVVLVCRARKTSVDELMTVKERLVQDGSIVLGTILNDCGPKASDRRYYRYCRRRQGYAA